MRRTLYLLAAAVACVLAGGWLLARTLHVSFGHGLYCSVGLGLTEGCDVAPHSGSARLVATLVMLIAIPLLAAGLARLTAIHTAAVWHRLHGPWLNYLTDLESRLKSYVASETGRHAAAVMDHADARHDALQAAADKTTVHAKLNTLQADVAAAHAKLDALSANLSALRTAPVPPPATGASSPATAQQGTGKTARSGKRV